MQHVNKKGRKAKAVQHFDNKESKAKAVQQVPIVCCQINKKSLLLFKRSEIRMLPYSYYSGYKSALEKTVLKTPSHIKSYLTFSSFLLHPKCHHSYITHIRILRDAWESRQ